MESESGTGIAQRLRWPDRGGRHESLALPNDSPARLNASKDSCCKSRPQMWQFRHRWYAWATKGVLPRKIVSRCREQARCV